MRKALLRQEQLRKEGKGQEKGSNRQRAREQIKLFIRAAEKKT